MEMHQFWHSCLHPCIWQSAWHAVAMDGKLLRLHDWHIVSPHDEAVRLQGIRASHLAPKQSEEQDAASHPSNNNSPSEGSPFVSKTYFDSSNPGSPRKDSGEYAPLRVQRSTGSRFVTLACLIDKLQILKLTISGLLSHA